MFLECKQLFDIVGERIGIDYQLDLSEYQLFSGKPFHTPVTVKALQKIGQKLSHSTWTVRLPCGLIATDV